MIRRAHIGVLILTLVFLIGGLLSYALIKAGRFPVARVNGDFISYRAVKENADISRRLYSQGLAGFTAEWEELFKRGGERELARKSFETLIVNAVIRTSASEQVLAEAEGEVAKSFDPAAAANLVDLVNDVYSWDMAKFKERILEPQALLDVLSREKGDGLNDWLDSAKSKAKVQIWFVPFKWENGEVVDKIKN